MDKILIATTNPGKALEFKSLLVDLPARLLTLTDLGIDLVVEEDGKTYYQNALKKARAYCQESGLITLADDSGLEVDVLHGAPGLYSARYSPLPGANDADRRAHLLNSLQPFPPPWRARFFCTLVLALPDENHYSFEGICNGKIIATERGTNGFGYDPIFQLSRRKETMAELPDSDKNRFSHRGKAVKAALPTLERILTQTPNR